MAKMNMIKGNKSNRGAAAVEFALILPVLTLLVLGTIEFGVLFYNKQVITNASREGARAGITRVVNGSVADENSIGELVVTYTKDRLITFNLNPTLPPPTISVSGVGGAFQTDLTVTVTYVYDWCVFNHIVGLFSPFTEWEPQTNIVAQTVMKMEQDPLAP